MEADKQLLHVFMYTHTHTHTHTHILNLIDTYGIDGLAFYKVLQIRKR